MLILELFAGVSTGRFVLEELGIKVEACYSSEIKEAAIKCAKDNLGDKITHVGDVTKIHYKNGILYTEKGDFKAPKIDLITSGSPCQDFSQANKERLGLDGKKSGLFFEFVRLLKEIKPTYFFQENVEMDMQANNIISKTLGVDPININSSLVSAQMRNRWYWTNIQGDEQTLFGTTFSQPKDKRIKLQDILEYGYTDREKSRCVTESDSRPNSTPSKMFHRYYSTGFTTLIFKDRQHYLDCKKHYDTYFQGDVKKIDEFKGDLSVYDGVRYLTQTELERCQTFPDGFTKSLTRNEAASVMGDGWTKDIIKHFFKNLK